MTQFKKNLIPYKICEMALTMIAAQGFEAVALEDIARRSGVELAEMALYFGDKQDIILFHYLQINADWLLFVEEMEAQDLATRFDLAMKRKIELVQPHAEALGQMMGGLMRSSKIGVGSARTAHVRAMGLRVMQILVNGAKDGDRLGKRIANLPSLLYLLHWAVLLLQVQSGAKDKALSTVDMVVKLLKQAKQIAFLIPLLSFLQELGNWADTLVDVAAEDHAGMTKDILKVIFNHRKLSGGDEACFQNNCPTCISIHADKVQHFVNAGQPIHFVLPAFPAKSPNSEKVLGKLPDLGEEIALVNLQGLCDEISAFYPPGASMTICSDGRIFSELVGVTEEDVTAYVSGIQQMITDLGLQRIEILNLEDLLPNLPITDAKAQIMETLAEPLSDYQARLAAQPEFKALFNGMHRFITEDRLALTPQKSSTQIKQESKEIALQVIRHSNAWTRFITQIYPDAVRLSIHPYPAHASKIGIQLTKAADNWITPWHGAILLDQGGYQLIKKGLALAQGAVLEERHNRPYLLRINRAKV